MKSKRILVSGSSGFLGSNLCSKLIKDGHNVEKLDLIDDGSGTTIIEDISNIPDSRLYALGNFDVIYYLASPCSVVQFNKEPVKCIRNTIHGFSNVLKLANKSTRVIYPSSGNVYGLSKEYKENSIPIPTNLYAVSKLSIEDMALQSDKDTLGFRIFAGYGDREEKKGELSSVVGLFTKDILNNKDITLWGDGNQTRDFIYISDIVEALSQSIYLKSHPRIFNLGTGVNISFNDLILKISTIANKNIPKINYVDKPVSYVDNTCADMNLFNKYFKINMKTIEEGIKSYLNYLKVN